MYTDPKQLPVPSSKNIDELACRALHEDIGDGDLTARLVAPERYSTASVIVKETAVLCGSPWFDSVFRQLDKTVNIEWHVKDGDTIHENQILCTLSGSSRILLNGERTALNFIQTLSGTATVTRQYCDILADSGTKLLDTRKTIPGLREAQKYAVRCGGGCNHRLGLFDAILIKENHIAMTGSIAEIINTAKQLYPNIPVEIEIEAPAQLPQAIEAGADLILLDNFSIAGLLEAVAITGNRVPLEASGNLDQSNISKIAATGVDYISIGALTKNIKATDLSMRFA